MRPFTSLNLSLVWLVSEKILRLPCDLAQASSCCFHRAVNDSSSWGKGGGPNLMSGVNSTCTWSVHPISRKPTSYHLACCGIFGDSGETLSKEWSHSGKRIVCTNPESTDNRFSPCHCLACRHNSFLYVFFGEGGVSYAVNGHWLHHESKQPVIWKKMQILLMWRLLGVAPLAL